MVYIYEQNTGSICHSIKPKNKEERYDNQNNCIYSLLGMAKNKEEALSIFEKDGRWNMNWANSFVNRINFELTEVNL